MGKKDDERVLISPVAGRKSVPLTSDVLMAMTSVDLGGLVSLAEAERIPGSSGGLFNLFSCKGAALKRAVTIAGPFLGAPQAVLGLEQIIARGGTRIWILGWCGSLQREVKIGDLVIPTGAISEEGTSGHYPIGAKDPVPDPRMIKMIENEAGSRSLRFYKGIVWTTDAIYRETAAKVSAFQRQGVLGVEMEMSALFTVAAYRNVALAGLLVVSDELSELRWRPGFGSAEFKSASGEACSLLLDLAGRASAFNNTR
ncbi:MAG: purine-nucleoside phosphorylase [Desulfobacteraceae bacterium]|jgi:uridine phosphorylase|nr:MAG: purine-nucleoside phosphorylase [Desulfobacteraceae bacterium]